MKFNIQKFNETSSTNDDAKHAAETGAPEGLVIWSLRQSAGRGRLGRVWESSEGNLSFSLLVRPSVPVREYGRYSFIAALAVYDVVAEILKTAGTIEIKWPNDILVGGKKISGILLEAGDGWLVIGIGLNVLQMPKNPLYPVTSLAAETQDVPTVEFVLKKVLEAFAVWDGIANQQGFAPLRAAWLSRARKSAMRVRLPQEEIQGDFLDLDETGNLRLRLENGTERCLSSGDVFF